MTDCTFTDTDFAVIKAEALQTLRKDLMAEPPDAAMFDNSRACAVAKIQTRF